MEKTVIELFAGVGGFRVAFNDVTFSNGKTKENKNFNFLWANQWEPSTKSQDAFNCYRSHFFNRNNENEFSNINISLVDKTLIPNHTVLCGGFPCQDYSVARSLSNEKGIEGKKGVLWWDIYNILKVKKPPFVLLENVDRLLKSPSKQRGRDFGIMLKCFNDLGYNVERRVINAAEYGFSQRRRRTYIFAYLKNTNFYKSQKSINDIAKIIKTDGFFGQSFKIKKMDDIKSLNINNDVDLVYVSNNFKFSFCNSGALFDGNIYTTQYEAKDVSGLTLKDIVQNNVDKKYFLNDEQVQKFKYLRGSKKIKRKRPNGEFYYYSEGAMSPYDSLDLPGRTMLTSEGTVNRSSHIILDPYNNKLRFLTPIECERLNGFPDDWTNTGMSEKRRYFMMGNALVVGIIRIMAKRLGSIIDKE